jgi:hypothetical protein
VKVICPEPVRNMNDVSDYDEEDDTSYASVFGSFTELCQEREELIHDVVNW